MTKTLQLVRTGTFGLSLGVEKGDDCACVGLKRFESPLVRRTQVLASSRFPLPLSTRPVSDAWMAMWGLILTQMPLRLSFYFLNPFNKFFLIFRIHSFPLHTGRSSLHSRKDVLMLLT